MPAQAVLPVRRWVRPRMLAGLAIMLAGLAIVSARFVAYVQAHAQVEAALLGGTSAALDTALG